MENIINSNIKISIIIPTWNSGKHLHTCLIALSNQTNKDFEVILVDNGSRDYQPGKICSEWTFLHITEIILNENIGFAAACNLAANKAEGKWLAFLNADAFPSPNWLELFLIAIKNFPNSGAFGCLVLQNNHPDLVDSAGDIYNISGIAWKGYGGYPANIAPSAPYRIFSPCAAAAFYRKDIFLKIGGFDEDFFSYFEDVDLGFRLNLHGYECIFLPDSRVLHIGSVSTGKDSDFALYHYHRNMVWSYIKNMPGILFWLYLPAHLLANVLFLLKYLKNGRGNVVLKAKIDAFKKLRIFWEKRRYIQIERVAPIGEINRLFNKNLLAPYIVGRRLRRYNQRYSGKQA